MMGFWETHPYSTLATLVFAYMFFKRLKNLKGSIRNRKSLPLPPGPKNYPLIGCVLDFPSNSPWLVYDGWSKTYGDMIYFNVFGQHYLVLSSPQRIIDLFQKKSLNYSGNRMLPSMVRLMGLDFLSSLIPYGAQWRKHRKMFHEHFHINAVHKYLPIQTREAHALLRRLLSTPENFLGHIEHTFAATIMKVTYGIDVQESDDSYILLAEESLRGINEAVTLGAFWGDFLPIFQYIPSWVPGASFQNKAANWRNINASMIEKPFHYVKQQLNNGKAPPSIAASFIQCLPHEDDPQRPIEEKIARDVAATVHIGGAETTVSAVQALFLAMALHPEIQKKAQAEIDAVVGPNRLPNFDDRPFLPYINAIMKESMRWHLVSPLGLPHMATDDDEYDGYYIPKGTIVFGNAWSILHDPKHFDNPMEYQPERYLKDGKLNPDVMDPDFAAFGFGRRACPGRHFSDNSLYLIISCLLAAYDIRPPVDDRGAVIELKPEFTSTIISFPVPFNCIIKPRTPEAEALIRASVHEVV